MNIIILCIHLFLKTLKVPESVLKTLTYKYVTNLFSTDAQKIQQVNPFKVFKVKFGAKSSKPIIITKLISSHQKKTFKIGN